MDKSGNSYLTSRTSKVEWSGIRIISTMLSNIRSGAIALSIGQPDFDTPKHIVEAAKRALDEGYTRYPPAKGFQDLREAIANKLRIKNNIIADPNSEVFVSSGAMHAIFNAVLQIVDPGDEVIVIDPGFDYYSQIRLFGGIPVTVGAQEQNGYKVDPADIRNAASNKTKLLILNSPTNPTGALLDRQTIHEIAEIAKENDFFVLSDEPYEDIIFNGEHVSIGSIDGMKGRTISVFTLSKSYAMTGWRVGYVTAPRSFIDEMEKLMEHMLSGVTAVSQRAALAAIEGPQDCVREMTRKYKQRRDLVCRALDEIEGVSYVKPEATFYVFPNVASICNDSWRLSKYLIAEQNLGTIPGRVFGAAGEGHLRLSFAASEATLKDGLSRLRRGIEVFKHWGDKKTPREVA
jgi:aspartate/methionine/tyrosine aminotransferase